MDDQLQQINGSETGYTRFLRSVIWADMKRELEVWKMLAESEYREAKDMEAVARIQGRVEGVEYLLQMPNMLLDALIASSDKNYRKEEEDA